LGNGARATPWERLLEPCRLFCLRGLDAVQVMKRATSLHAVISSVSFPYKPSLRRHGYHHLLCHSDDNSAHRHNQQYHCCYPPHNNNSSEWRQISHPLACSFGGY